MTQADLQTLHSRIFPGLPSDDFTLLSQSSGGIFDLIFLWALVVMQLTHMNSIWSIDVFTALKKKKAAFAHRLTVIMH